MSKVKRLHEWGAKRDWIGERSIKGEDVPPNDKELKIGCLMNITDALNKQNELLEKQNELLNKQNELFDKYLTEMVLRNFQGN